LSNLISVVLASLSNSSLWIFVSVFIVRVCKWLSLDVTSANYPLRFSFSLSLSVIETQRVLSSDSDYSLSSISLTILFWSSFLRLLCSMYYFSKSLFHSSN